jgi:hypothetical protein
MRLRPEICQIIEQNSVISRSRWPNQHQGLDAILEEINKTLKALIPPIPSQKHWEIAARNCTKFMKVRINDIQFNIYIIYYFLPLFISRCEKNCLLQLGMKILKVLDQEHAQILK